MVERDWWKDDDVSDVAEAFETEHSEGCLFRNSARRRGGSARMPSA